VTDKPDDTERPERRLQTTTNVDPHRRPQEDPDAMDA